jgi:hypothetical protein
LRRKLCRLSDAFTVLRHITRPSVDKFCNDVNMAFTEYGLVLDGRDGVDDPSVVRSGSARDLHPSLPVTTAGGWAAAAAPSFVEDPPTNRELLMPPFASGPARVLPPPVPVSAAEVASVREDLLYVRNEFQVITGGLQAVAMEVSKTQSAEGFGTYAAAKVCSLFNEVREYVISNDALQASTPGLRATKNLSDFSFGIPWGSAVHGVIDPDGLQKAPRHLPHKACRTFANRWGGGKPMGGVSPWISRFFGHVVGRTAPRHNFHRIPHNLQCRLHPSTPQTARICWATFYKR